MGVVVRIRRRPGRLRSARAFPEIPLKGGDRRLPLKRSAKAPSSSQAQEAVREIYRELADRPIERQCTRRTECCHFRLTGRTPFLTKGEALVAARALRASGRKSLPERTDGACPLLHPTTGQCLIYDGRPFGCRTHFCSAAGGPYARREVVDLIHRLETLDHALAGCGAMALPVALQQVLRAST